MNCPTSDKLEKWFDGIVEETEYESIQMHVKTCDHCKQLMKLYSNEHHFLKETLSTPKLPDDFAANVLDQLEPYEAKKRKTWKRLLVPAAAALLAAGLTTTLHPSFAQWVGGFFSTEQVDEGLRKASEAGLADRVNQEVTDQGITFKVEDVLADSSRVALSYQLLNKNRKALNPHLDIGDTGNTIKAFDQNGNTIENLGMSWSDGSDYGLIEFSLRELESIETLTIKFELNELNRRTGNWQLEIPINLKESKKLTTKLTLPDQKTSANGVGVHLKEVQFAPSSNEIMYDTYLTDGEQAKIKAQIQRLEDTFGKENIHSFTGFGTAIQYHIENEKGKAISHHNAFFNQGHPSDRGLLQGTGEDTGELGHVKWNDSFLPNNKGEQLTFVLDGVIKTVPVSFPINIKPKELKQEPLSFEYEGNFMTVKKAHMENEYSLRKALIPIEVERIFKIEMEGSKEVPSSDLGAWILVDEKGNVHEAFHSGEILDEKDENGRFKTNTTLTIYGMEEVPEELTLQLLSVTRYEKVKKPWRVPLYK
ncbi:DUF4179 domain-containing protein [Mesobacillus foraminis]|uniref:DUF4179 domain-containing protein n=1 Tax=Mesobacillus foraminis TaxID=279826 RepID=UPI0039A025EB